MLGLKATSTAGVDVLLASVLLASLVPSSPLSEGHFPYLPFFPESDRILLFPRTSELSGQPASLPVTVFTLASQVTALRPVPLALQPHVLAQGSSTATS